MCTQGNFTWFLFNYNYKSLSQLTTNLINHFYCYYDYHYYLSEDRSKFKIQYCSSRIYATERTSHELLYICELLHSCSFLFQFFYLLLGVESLTKVNVRSLSPPTTQITCIKICFIFERQGVSQIKRHGVCKFSEFVNPICTF